ncbi:related to Aminoadipate-semialdehyde dehydrogenase [Melanopsichium pennsylvanicum]|uniref:Related to Aminoadipate-semialdehyde dehydrogenase n=2 Tax=Melanopsichium pennsylvanicum TaxID=63383 RepID=A0AAJ4XRQ5_9BASI|nr:related to Aminoadipate-semialdehyde dehydrogenase [Melanopsichium pennsylvanicum 4]SNX87157.1 related to Aminoadipate-semialdehyde dehydrogenase [Melanopsichium pennsylvanicum]
MPILDTNLDLNALFRNQVQTTPDALSLVDPSASYTYAQLDEKVESLSLYFRSQHAVARDSLVGILMGRGADYVIACLAALRAGGAFLVLELAYPLGLLHEVIKDAQPVVVVTQVEHAKLVPKTVPSILIDHPEHASTLFQQADAPSSASSSSSLPSLPRDTDLERLAFVSYSSGTTGKPKGIANPHRAPVKSYDLRFGVNDLKAGDRVACNVYFVWEMLRPLLRGATTYAIPDHSSYDPVKLVDLLSTERITETLMTPTLLAAVLARHHNLGAKLPDLRSLWLNGEVVTTDLARRAIKALPNTRLLNCYSASETHEVACGDLRQMLPTLPPDAAYCPVGPPLDTAHTYILDDDERPLQPGEPGELYVGGDLLARGYLNLVDTTAKAFTPDTSANKPNARKYRTGDLARIIPETGLLEITGRVGGMIKIRGYSIVPAIVEKAIVDNFDVSNCAVIAHGEGLERQLVAYVVPDEAERGDRTILTIDDNGHSPSARQILVSHLAHYMIPTLWVVLHSLPTHEVSGKVDLKNLPNPKAAIAAASGTNSRARSPAPDETVNLKSIAQLWALSLNINPNTVLEAGKTVSFFDLGGHSLLLADLATRISKTMGGFSVPLAELAGHPTLQDHVRVTLNARDGYNAAVQADLPTVLRADIELAPEFKLASPERIKGCPLSEAKTILLTGATGFLGGFLLHDLIQNTSARIVCLIRFNAPYRTDRSAAMARVRRNMLDLGFWDHSMLDRIDVLPANLSRNRLGLVPEVYENLVETVDVIVHCAAQVNLVYPYAALRDANVEGTREILRLAFLSNATVQYVSTNGVLPPSKTGWPESTIMPLEDVPDKLLDGYCQTKWVAEQLVLESAKRGLPANVIRIGTISGHSETGSTNTYDLITALIVESVHLGVAPEIPDWHIEMTAVDFVSRGIIAIGNHIAPNQRIYHLGDSEPIDCRLLFQHLGTLGYPTTRTNWKSWVALWQDKRGSAKGGDHGFTVDVLRSGMPSEEFLLGIIALKDDATRPALGELKRPKVDAKLLQTYARHWYARGWMQRQPSSVPGTPNGVNGTSALAAARAFDPHYPLRGKVAVITGASSGIGAAVARALIREGAHVALAARRVDALEKLQSELVKISRSSGALAGGKVHVHKTDVVDRMQVDSLMQTTTDNLGQIDIIVSCAGVMYYTLMENIKTDEWDQTVDVNCKGLLNVLSTSLPRLLPRKTGHIVAISSDAGRKVFPGLGVYSASKFFVEAALQSLRLETAGTGLRVTAVQPGNTATDLLGMSSDQEAIKKYGEPTGAKILDPSDVANAIVYALRQPDHVAMNEILIEPRDEPI